MKKGQATSEEMIVHKRREPKMYKTRIGGQNKKREISYVNEFTPKNKVEEIKSRKKSILMKKLLSAF